MARALADVLHYFLDEAPRDAGPAVPLLAVPLADGDALRAAFVWQLAVELARAGARPAVALPAAALARELAPDPPPGGALAPEVLRVPAADPVALADAALALRREPRRGPVLALVPPAWIGAGAPAPLLGWTLLFATPEPDALDAAATLAARVAAAAPGARVGATLHGVESVAEARAAYEALALRCAARVRGGLWSYGLLLDDLDVYRGLAEGRAVGLARPQSRAARALADVARLLLEDARACAAAA